MARSLIDVPPSEDPHAQLERSLIEEYLVAHGTSLTAVQTLPPEDAAILLNQACLYASGRLTEVESRAHYVEELHRGTASPSNPPRERR